MPWFSAVTRLSHWRRKEAPSACEDLIRKNLTEKQILDACDTLISRDILNLKLYFIIGLPTETETDLEELIRLVTAIRERVLEQGACQPQTG